MLVRAQDLPANPEEQYRLAIGLYGHGEYAEALRAFTRALASPDAALTLRARKGTVRAALRIAEFDVARREAETLARDAGMDAEALTLYGDALWSAGRFDEADREYTQALALDSGSSRARFGLARSLGARSRLREALAEARAALRSAPRDPDLHALAGTIAERLNRFDEAADAYVAYADLLPVGEAMATSIARGRAGFLRSFEGREPLSMNSGDAGGVHTVPFKLVRNKVVVQGRLNGLAVEWVLDTGAERTGVSQALATSARIRPVGTTLTAGVGRAALRRVQLGRADILEIGSLSVHNVPVSIRQPAIGGAPRWQGLSLSPLALGLSVVVDYGRKRVTLARALPDTRSDVTLPMRIHRLPFVRGTLNATHAAYFVVDTGGEVISISAETAQALGMEPVRRIPLRVFGLSGQDEGAFLLPGVDLDFEEIEYRKVGLAVLNLRAPSVLLGFQVGGIVGHTFLSGYRVSIDVPRSEVRLVRSVVGG